MKKFSRPDPLQRTLWGTSMFMGPRQANGGGTQHHRTQSRWFRSCLLQRLVHIMLMTQDMVTRHVLQGTQFVMTQRALFHDYVGPQPLLLTQGFWKKP